MKELVPALWDDLDLDQAGRRVPAHGTVTLGFMGEWAELDLTAEHLEALEKMVSPWMKAGHKPEKTPKPAANHAPRRSKDYYEGLRAWAADQDITIRQDGSGKYAYPAALRRRYDSHLAEQAAG